MKAKRKINWKRFFGDLVLMLLGATLVACGTKYIYDPGGLVTGGVSGLSIVLRELTERSGGMVIPLWMGNIILNVPIFILALITDGPRNLLRTIFVWGVTTAELYFFPDMAILPDNLLLVAVYGGIFFGVGTGLLIQAQSTSGGSDLLGYSLHHFFRSISYGRIIQIIDGLVVLAGAIVFNVEHTLYAIISVYIMGRITDYIISAGRSARMALIISEKSDLIATDILEQLDRGVTGLKGRGMYTGDDKVVLVCICSTRDIVRIKDIVREYDRKAFFVVADVAEAMGEGFLEEWD